jgi:molybdopterin-containing oxidoreductase family iron-sulfur binding subunit
MSEKHYWRSLDALADTPETRVMQTREFPEGADELEVDPVSRRSFLGLMGASMGLAGMLGAGCIRKPTQYILPYTRRPEDLIPGEARYFATSMQVGGSVLGLLVESQDGRPTKIEGNPRHPMSLGATDALAQGTILGLYDPDRGQAPIHNGETSDWDAVVAALRGAREAMTAARGQGWGLLLRDERSPSLTAMVRHLQQRLPQLKVYVHDETRNQNQIDGLAMLGAGTTAPLYHLDRAVRVVALDSDFLGMERDSVLHTRRFSQLRRPADEHGAMSRLYAVEPAFTVTGATADNRLQLPASQVGEFLRALIVALGQQGVTLPAGLQGVSAGSVSERAGAWARTVAEDLAGHRGASVLVVGARQPAWVHAAAMLVNEALGGLGSTVTLYQQPDRLVGSGLDALAADLGGDLQHLVVLGGNPVYEAPGDVDMEGLLGRLQTSIHLAFHADETSAACQWYIPQCHALESWGDHRATDGTLSIQQPLIDPLYPSWCAQELLAHFMDDETLGLGLDAERDGDAHGCYALVRRHWRLQGGVDFERSWRTALHEGVLASTAVETVTSLQPRGVVDAMQSVAAPTQASLELVFALDNKVLDGRFANIAWLQELPDPITKLTWDNAALVGVNTARALGIRFENSIDPYDGPSSHDADIPSALYARIMAPYIVLTAGGRTLRIPAMVTPGVADNTILLPLGYGRRADLRVARTDGGDVGFDVSTVRSVQSQGWVTGATVSVESATYMLATTQDHGSMEGRPIAREATLEHYREHPAFTTDEELMPDYKLRSLWEPPNRREGQQWGMSIDLTTCTGCSACTIACQAENNISVVGKREVANGREMHWIRLDRYFSGPADQPEAIMQPIACVHCEMAPCEQVCPVAATVHGPEGTNDMAYNRCIGTRYCANNCPYKVRRFNFFNYSKRNDERNPLYRLQKNPDVTVRFRGVMEKCTYCIQRVNGARIDAKVNGNDIIQDGAVTPACAQVCPSQAIVFGDINDPNSRVSQAKRMNRDYAVLSWLNIHPRTTYLAKLRYPNPALAGV